LVGDEGGDAGVTVGLRVGDEGESSRHLSVCDEIFRASVSVGALLVEDAIEISVKGLLFSCVGSESI
jgi:hypothetical protein